MQVMDMNLTTKGLADTYKLQMLMAYDMQNGTLTSFEDLGVQMGDMTIDIASIAVGGTVGKGVKLISRAGTEVVAGVAKGGLSNARALGIAGEEAVGVGSKVRIESLTGTANYRIPDMLTRTTIEEVKNVGHQSLTRQLMDFHLYSQKNGLNFSLHTRPNTTFSVPLQNMINNGSVIIKPIPFR
jgi:hypothetical protein